MHSIVYISIINRIFTVCITINYSITVYSDVFFIKAAHMLTHIPCDVLTLHD
jgi:hypothetical protein